jgi:Leucine-rich repeat (LRR) protein
VLAGNPVSDYSPLYGMTNLVNLWLHDNTITNAQFLTQLPWLNHLNLDHNQITDLTFLSAFTNLTGLGLSRNPVADYSPLAVAAFTNLNSLRLEGDCLSEADVASFIAPFQSLAFLSLNHNRIANLTPVTSPTA